MSESKIQYISGETGPIIMMDYLVIRMFSDVSEGMLSAVAGITDGSVIYFVIFVKVDDVIDGSVFIFENFPCAFYYVVESCYMVYLEILGRFAHQAHGCFMSEYPFTVDQRASYSVFNFLKKAFTHMPSLYTREGDLHAKKVGFIDIFSF